MDAYTFYYNLKVCNSKDTTKTMEQPAHQMNMAQKHYYLVANEKPIAHDALMMDLYLYLDLVASFISE